MTRETKIGLLIGLGFIVVFAVLLSHTGSPVPAGDGLSPGPRSVSLPGKTSPLSLRVVDPPTARPDRARGAETVASAASRPAGRVGLSEFPVTSNSLYKPAIGSNLDSRLAELPEPRGLARNQPGPAPVADAGSGAESPWQRILSNMTRSSEDVRLAASGPPRSNLPAGRVAPPRQEVTTAVQPPAVAAPQPTARPALPAVTPASGVRPADPAPGGPQTSPPDRQEASREYIVQKGDTLRKIVKEQYGVTSLKVVEFVVASNKSRIKDKDTIREGQKLVVPPLPPEMFEPAPHFDVSGVGEAARTVTSEELTRPGATPLDRHRTAPSAVKRDLLAEEPVTAPADRNAAPADPPQESRFRFYEIRANETLRSIAARELGSPNHWNEIQRINPHLDPRKLMPGTKIKMPIRWPVSSAGAGSQVPV